MGADASDVGSIYIYDFQGDSWSKQPTSGAPASLTNSRSSAVLDHDTNVIYTVPGGGASMYALDLGNVQASAGGSAAWSQETAVSFSTDGDVTAALANNHINYFGVSGTAAGSAEVFVIHFSYFQPQAQAYPTMNGGKTFPDQPGQAVSVPTSGNSSPQQMLFVPNDFSSSYVVTHWTNPGDYSSMQGVPFAQDLINSTQILPAPTSQDKQAAYACSTDSCVQIDTKGDIYYISGAIKSDSTVDGSATWSKMGYSLGGGSASSGNSTTSSTDTGAASSASNSASGASATQASTSGTGSPKPSGTASSTAKPSSETTGKGNGSGTLRVNVSALTLALLAAASLL